MFRCVHGLRVETTLVIRCSRVVAGLQSQFKERNDSSLAMLGPSGSPKKSQVPTWRWSTCRTTRLATWSATRHHAPRTAMRGTSLPQYWSSPRASSCNAGSAFTAAGRGGGSIMFACCGLHFDHRSRLYVWLMTCAPSVRLCTLVFVSFSIVATVVVHDGKMLERMHGLRIMTILVRRCSRPYRLLSQYQND